MNKPIIICLAVIMCCAFASSSAVSSRIYQIVCKNFGCDQAFSKCILEGCVGPQCDRCMVKDHPECGPCVEEFDDDSNYVKVGSYKYLLCDPKFQNQVDACEFQCRRNYFITDVGSLCLRFGNIPVCQCAGWSPAL